MICCSLIPFLNYIYELRRTVLFVTYSVTFTAFIGMPCLLCGIAMKLFCSRQLIENFMWYYFKIFFTGLLISCGVSVEIRGMHNIDASTCYVFACNHISWIDGPMMVAILPYYINGLLKKSLIYIPVLGYIGKLAGIIFVSRTNTASDIQILDKAIEYLIENPRSILLFPEGTRSKDGSLQPFKTGGFILSIKTKMPIVPIAIIGSELVTKGYVIRAQKVIIKIGKPIRTNHLHAITDKTLLANTVYSEIEKLQQEL